MKRLLCVGMLFAICGCQSADRNNPLQIKESAHAQYAQEEQVYNNDAALSPSEVTHTVNIETPYYELGPQQGRPADGVLSSGTKIKLIESAGSYALIVTESGITGYVSVNDIKPVQE